MDGRRDAPDRRAPPGRPAVWVILPALLLAAAGLRLPGLGAAPLWLDECSSIETALLVARAEWGNVARALLRGLSAYFLLLAPWVGEEVGEWAVRLPSVLAGIALVPVGWLLGHQIGGRPLAWRLGLAVAWSPFFVWHSREVRWYPLAWLLAGLGAVCFVKGLRAPSWSSLAGWLVFGLTASLTFSPAVVLLLIQIGWIAAVWLSRRGDGGPPRPVRPGLRLARHAFLVSLAALAAVWLWVALLSPALRGGSRGFGFSNLGGPRIGAVLYSPVALGTGYTIGPGPLEWHTQPTRPPAVPELLAMSGAIAALVGLLTLGWKTMAESGQRALAAVLLSLGLAPPAAVVAASLWTDHRFAPRHVGMSFLYLLCLAAAGTLGAGSRRRLGAALGSALLLLQAASLVNLHTSARYGREDVRSAAAHVARAAAPEDRVLIFGGVGLPWKRYYRGQAPWEVVSSSPSRGWSRERIRERTREAREIFVVRGLILEDAGERSLLQALTELTEPIEEHPFYAVEVTRRRGLPGDSGGAAEPTGP